MNNTYGIKISKEGTDATSQNVENFIIDSSFENLKGIPSLCGKKSAYVEKQRGETSATYTIEHNLGYVPFCLIGIYIPSTETLGSGYFNGAINMVPFRRNIHYGAGVDEGNWGKITELNNQRLTIKYDRYYFVAPPPHPEVGGYEIIFYYMIFANKLE